MKMGGRRNQMGGKILEITIDRKREKSIPVGTNSNTQSNSFSLASLKKFAQY
jgi:hypothetical protein